MERIAHGGNLKQAAEVYGFTERELLDFSANINPLGMPPELTERFKTDFWRLLHYPDPDCQEARSALAGYHGCPTREIAVGNGATELFSLLALTFKPRRILCPEPTYGGYRFIAQLLDIPYEGVLLPDLRKLSAEDLISRVQERDMVFICNPNNPTGQLWRNCDIEGLITATGKQGAFLVLDESFIEFVSDPEASKTPMVYRELPPHLAIVRSLTKIMAIPGLRLGYLRANHSVVEGLWRKRDPWSTNAMALEAAKMYPELEGYRRKARELVSKETEYLASHLRSIPGIEPLPGTANFMLLDCRGLSFPTDRLIDELGSRGVLVRDCSTIHGMTPGLIRIAVRNNGENKTLIKHVAEICRV